MIEINLLPGAKRSKKGGGGGPSINFAAIGAAISAKVKDKFLAAAVLSGAAAIAVISLLFLSQRNRETTLNAAAAKAAADSSKYAVVLLDRARAEARLDSVMIQLSIIRAIDEDRYIWPHVLEEISRALPIYTWLRSVTWNGVPQGANPASAVKAPPPDTGKVKRRRGPTLIPRDTVHIRVIGRTVDIQALTRFMRSLEDSPFLSDIQLQRSEIQIESGKEITQFVLDALFNRPDTTFLRRAPFTVTQR